MSEETTKTTDTTATTSRGKAKVWASIVIGAMLVIAGGFGVFKTEAVNNLMIETGAEQSALGIIELQPDASKAIGVTADVIDSAIKARTASPDQLTILITEELKKIGVEGKLIKPILEMVIEQLNEAYKVSDTEAEYLAKAQAVANGLRAAVPVTE